MLMWCTSLFCARTKHKTHFSKEPVSITKELKREKSSKLLRRIFSSRQAWALFFVILALWAGMLALLARGQYHMGSICMRCHDQRLVS